MFYFVEYFGIIIINVFFGNLLLSCFIVLRGMVIGFVGSLYFINGEYIFKLFLSNMGRVCICIIMLFFFLFKSC